MILDFAYHKYKKQMYVSYITERGSKALREFNVSRFKSYYRDPAGIFTNWDGAKCSARWIEKPGLFEYLNFLHELPEEEQVYLRGKYNPRLYTWDIETKFDPKEFPDPGEAKFPITVISVASDNLDVVELGTMDLSMEDQVWVQNQITQYLKQSEFYRSLNLPEPKFKYLKFNTEEDMISFFLTNIACKAPVLAGWNSDGFDSPYLQNRMTAYFPKLSMKMASPTHSCSPKKFQDKRGNKYILQRPDHTLMIDMMDVVENFDMTMGNKETLALDYIAKKCTGIGKIPYDGDLEQLRQTDYKKYVFYSCIDSILVQLISKKLRTMNNIYAQALYCKTKIGAAFSKIAISEAVVFDYFFHEGLKVVSENPDRVRPELIGAYVRQPTPGKFKYVCCNDFSSLYPSCIATCNLSFENFLGSVAGGEFKEEDLDKYRKDPQYFVSVNGSVYKNDKPYAFKIIQLRLKEERNVSKYLSKQLYADVLNDAKHLRDGKKPGTKPYNDAEVKKLAELGYSVKTPQDLVGLDLNKFIYDLSFEIEYLQSFEQACKLVMNSMYGGSSHLAFHWFNIHIANDITGEGRNLIHKMEDHIPNWIDENWISLTEVHKQLGITLKKNFKHHNLIELIAGDTDSLYSCYSNWVDSIEGSENMSLEQIRDLIVKFNTGFFDQHNKAFMDEYYKGRHCESIHNFELETVAYADIRLDVKKRYAQMLLWKDGYCPDVDNLPFKSKGLETVKASYPELARKQLQAVLEKLLLSEKTGFELTHFMNQLVQQDRQVWLTQPVEDLCENKGINGYTKYVLDDSNPAGLIVNSKCPYHIRALATRNWTIQTQGLHGQLQYGGKMKIYPVQRGTSGGSDQYFAFMAGEYPAWAEKYWPVDRMACFQKFYLDPLNRILTSIGQPEISITGYVQTSLF